MTLILFSYLVLTFRKSPFIFISPGLRECLSSCVENSGTPSSNVHVLLLLLARSKFSKKLLWVCDHVWLVLDKHSHMGGYKLVDFNSAWVLVRRSEYARALVILACSLLTSDLHNYFYIILNQRLPVLVKELCLISYYTSRHTSWDRTSVIQEAGSCKNTTHCCFFSIQERERERDWGRDSNHMGGERERESPHKWEESPHQGRT